MVLKIEDSYFEIEDFRTEFCQKTRGLFGPILAKKSSIKKKCSLLLPLACTKALLLYNSTSTIMWLTGQWQVFSSFSQFPCFLPYLYHFFCSFHLSRHLALSTQCHMLVQRSIYTLQSLLGLPIFQLWPQSLSQIFQPFINIAKDFLAEYQKDFQKDLSQNQLIQTTTT